jgi:hypothetical protein
VRRIDDAHVCEIGLLSADDSFAATLFLDQHLHSICSGKLICRIMHNPGRWSIPGTVNPGFVFSIISLVRKMN